MTEYHTRPWLPEEVDGVIVGGLSSENRMSSDRINAASPWRGLKASGIGQESGVGGYRVSPKRGIVNMSNEPFDQFASYENTTYA